MIEAVVIGDSLTSEPDSWPNILNDEGHPIITRSERGRRLTDIDFEWANGFHTVILDIGSNDAIATTFWEFVVKLHTLQEKWNDKRIVACLPPINTLWDVTWIRNVYTSMIPETISTINFETLDGIHLTSRAQWARAKQIEAAFNGIT